MSSLSEDSLELVSRRSKKPELWAEIEKLRAQLQSSRQIEHIVRIRLADGEAELKRLGEQLRFSLERQRILTTENERLLLLLGLSQDLMALDPDRVLSTAVQKIPFILRARTLSIYLYDPERSLLSLKDTNHYRPIDPVIDLTKTTTSLMALAVRTRQTLIVSDVGAYQSRQSAANVELPHRERYGTPSCMVTPLLRGDRVLGVVNVADRLDGEAFDRADREAFIHIANLVSLSLETARRMTALQALEARDPLTGLATHRLALETMDSSLKSGRDVALLVLDLKSFSWINGNYGLPAGDSVLEQLAALLRAFCNSDEQAARLGGDDFALILPDSHLAKALGRARELIQKISAHDFRVGTHELKVEVTLGVAASRPGHSAAELLREAEAALAEARRRREAIGVRT